MGLKVASLAVRVMLLAFENVSEFLVAGLAASLCVRGACLSSPPCNVEAPPRAEKSLDFLVVSSSHECKRGDFSVFFAAADMLALGTGIVASPASGLLVV
jgi:hypothetical protein